MYIAYYVMRCDGDADLYAVVENGESVCEDLALSISDVIEQKLEEAMEEWFKVDHSECDFPDVWDLTSPDLVQ